MPRMNTQRSQGGLSLQVQKQSQLEQLRVPFLRVRGTNPARVRV